MILRRYFVMIRAYAGVLTHWLTTARSIEAVLGRGRKARLDCLVRLLCEVCNPKHIFLGALLIQGMVHGLRALESGNDYAIFEQAGGVT